MICKTGVHTNERSNMFDAAISAVERDEQMSIREKYRRYCNVRKQAQRKYLSYDLWKQEYATAVDLQMEGILK